MSSFVLHPDASRDIEDIWDYIAADSPDAASRVIEEIRNAIAGLVRFPYQGHCRSDLTSHPLRFQTVRDFLIAYAPEENPLLVLAILHGRRSPRVIAALLKGRE